jgi:hypothetical protein
MRFTFLNNFTAMLYQKTFLFFFLKYDLSLKHEFFSIIIRCRQMAPPTKTYRWRKNNHVVSNTLKTNQKLIIKTNKTKTFLNDNCLIVNNDINNTKKIFLNQLYNLSTTATLFNPLNVIMLFH